MAGLHKRRGSGAVEACQEHLFELILSDVGLFNPVDEHASPALEHIFLQQPPRPCQEGEGVGRRIPFRGPRLR